MTALFCQGEDCAMATLHNPQRARGLGWRVTPTSTLCQDCRKAEHLEAAA